MRKLLAAAALTIPTACTPVQANTQQIAELAVKALACAEVTPHATRALRFVMDGQPYELYYATTLARRDISDYQRWTLEGLFKGLEEAQLTSDEVLDFAEIWTAYCMTVMGHGKLGIYEKRQYRGE